MPVFGPGTLKIGETGSAIDVSCLINNAILSASPTTSDPTTKLCGTQRQGVTTYACTLAGNIDIDPATGDTGLFCLSWADPGTSLPFEFIPDTADGTKASGTLVVQPLDFGSSGTYGDDLTSDFEFQVLWKPTITCSGGADKGSASNGDVFPAEATVTASDSTNAAKLAGLGYVANPTTAWTAGQKITIGTYLFNWSGTAWAAGAHA
jgi:hypothetical protein